MDAEESSATAHGALERCFLARLKHISGRVEKNHCSIVCQAFISECSDIFGCLDRKMVLRPDRFDRGDAGRDGIVVM